MSETDSVGSSENDFVCEHGSKIQLKKTRMLTFCSLYLSSVDRSTYNCLILSDSLFYYTFSSLPFCMRKRVRDRMRSPFVLCVYMCMCVCV